jgi:hypothetical protein
VGKSARAALARLVHIRQKKQGEGGLRRSAKHACARWLDVRRALQREVGMGGIKGGTSPATPRKAIRRTCRKNESREEGI